MAFIIPEVSDIYRYTIFGGRGKDGKQATDKKRNDRDRFHVVKKQQMTEKVGSCQ